jgi:hypothetical protein
MLAIEGLALGAIMLHPFSRWITPEPLPRRYDTWFFVAELPDQQEPLHDAVETTESVWISPHDALARSERGEFPLVFATEMHLKRLARFASITDLIPSATPQDLRPIMPRIVRSEAETVFLLPGDEGY